MAGKGPRSITARCTITRLTNDVQYIPAEGAGVLVSGRTADARPRFSAALLAFGAAVKSIVDREEGYFFRSKICSTTDRSIS